jgi:hypothetical protein
MAHARTNERRTIFRERALDRYLQNQQRIVFLRLVQPRLLRYAWVLLACLALLVGLAWRTRVPVLANGTGLVIAASGAGPEARIVLLLPPDRLPQLKSEQRVILRDAEGRPALIGRIEGVEPEILSPSALRRRFDLDGAQASISRGPAAVALARIEPQAGRLPLAAYVGSSAPVEIQTGTRQLLGLIPGFRSLVREPAS